MGCTWMDPANINPGYILQQVGMLTCGVTWVILAVLRWRKGGVRSPRVQWCTVDEVRYLEYR